MNPELNKTPFFSVVVPLYNKRPYIRRTVDSILNQIFKDFELIVVDDGSTDDSIETLADILDSRLKIIHQDNRGVGAARNTGIAMAIANWIALIDADDIWAPDHLAELARIADRYPDAGLLSTSNIETDFAKQTFVIDHTQSEAIRIIDYFIEASKRIGVVHSSAAAIRRDVFKNLGGFTFARAGEDLEYWARIALHYPVAISSKATSFYFRGTGGVMEQIAAQPVKHLPPLKSLRELSPSVAMICDQAENDPTLWRNASICTYVNSRIFSGIKGALYRGDIAGAKQLKRFLLPQGDYIHYIYHLLLALPDKIIKLSIFIFMSVKQFFKTAKRYKIRKFTSST